MLFSNDMVESILGDYLSSDDIYQRDRLQCEFSELVEGITTELNLMTDIKRQLRDIADKTRILTEEHTKAYEELQVGRDEIIAQCRHHSSTHGISTCGPATICDTCGKEL